MKLSIVNNKLEQQALSMPIYNTNGMMYMNKGLCLNKAAIERIKSMGINTVYIDDGNAEVNLQEILDSNIKSNAIKLLKKEFENIKRTKTINENSIKQVLDMILENINLSENAFFFNNMIKTDELTDLAAHSINVTMFSLAVGVESKLNEKQLELLGTGALLHDIGKLVATDYKDHPMLGYKIARENHSLSPLSTIVILQHHEQNDGRGFPDKINGTKIHEYSKIVSISDTYVSYLFSGSYTLPNEVIEMIAAESPAKFDIDILKRFTHAIYCYPNGLSVMLNTGQTGTIIMQNKGFPSRPVVSVKSGDGNKYINLMKEFTIFIDSVDL